MLSKAKSCAHLSSDEAVRQSTMAMTVDEMATELRISLPNAYNLVKEASFPSFKIGSRILINRQGLQNWIDKKCEIPG